MNKRIFLIITSTTYVFAFFYLWKRSSAEKFNDRSRFFGAEKQLGGKYDDILNQLGFNDKPIMVNGKYPDFTFVTAFSDNHVGEGRHLVVNITRAFPGRKIFVYSMGLSEQNLEWFERAGNIQLRQANFTRYPEHVTDLFTYAFKPLIIAEALREFGAVFWVDTSAVFQKDRPIEGLLERIGNTQKSSEVPDVFLFQGLRHSINSTTHPGFIIMYRYLPPYQNEVTLNRFMFAASFQLVYRARPTMELVYKWYVLCALEKNCIAPKEAQMFCDKRIFHGEYGGCQRYDQL